MEEVIDVLDPETGERTGESLPRKVVHAEGKWHRVVHVWFLERSTGRLVLQRRHPEKESWPNLWDISAAGHIEAGESSLLTAQRESEEELGLVVPEEAVRSPLFTVRQESVQNDGKYINKEFCDVYLAELESLEKPSGGAKTPGQWKPEDFVMQDIEVVEVKLMPWQKVRQSYIDSDPTFVPADVVNGDYRTLFEELQRRCPV
jgi:isopentenyldiphosphate isomerase